MGKRMFFWFICLLLASSLNAQETNPKKPNSPKPRVFASLSNTDLIMLLQHEYETAELLGPGESNTNYFYDIVVEEFLYRRDIETIPLLLLRVNDNSPVVEQEEGKAWIWKSKYDTPVLVKFKARFTLYRLLDSEDYRQMIGFNSDGDVDLERAFRYYKENKETIKGRLKKLQTLEEIQKEMYQKLKTTEQKTNK